MVRPFRPEPDAGAIVQPEPAPLLLFWWDLQPFALPDTLDPLVVHMPARLVQQRRYRPVAVPAILRRQFDDVRRKTILIRAASVRISLSSVRSETARLSRAFSFSNSFSRFS
jgi:hypothetical protein